MQINDDYYESINEESWTAFSRIFSEMEPRCLRADRSCYLNRPALKANHRQLFK